MVENSEKQALKQVKQGKTARSFNIFNRVFNSFM